MPLGDQLRHELAITPQQFGFVVAAYGIAATISGILASFFVDRFDRKSTMLLSFAGFIAMTVYCGIATSYLHLLIARSLAGICGGIVSSTIMAFVVDLIPEGRRGRAIGVVSSSFAFASTIGLPIGLTLANWYQRFGVPFIAIAILGSIVWVLCLALLPSLKEHTLIERANVWRQFGAVVKQSNHLWSFAFMLCMVFGTFMIVPYIAPYYQANCGMSRARPSFGLPSRRYLHPVCHERDWLVDRSIWPTPDLLVNCKWSSGDDLDHHQSSASQPDTVGRGRNPFYGCCVESNRSSPSDDAPRRRSKDAGCIHKPEYSRFTSGDRNRTSHLGFDHRRNIPWWTSHQLLVGGTSTASFGISALALSFMLHPSPVHKKID